MPHRFPPLAPPEPARTRPMARALPAPRLRWVDALIFGVIVLMLRLV
jgi:hypothetical protein